MKLRQKLAMVLASAMIVTAIPVTTMAASTNGYNQTITVGKNDILNSATALALELKVDASDVSLVENKTFYVKATDFKFVKEDGTTRLTQQDFANVQVSSNVTVTPTSDTQLTVKITGDVDATKKVILPVLGKVTGEAPTITVDGEGTILSSGKYPIMGADQVATDKKVYATVGDATNVSVDGVGKIADITVTEVTKGKLDGQEIVIELDNSDLAFDASMVSNVATSGSLAGFGTLASAYYEGQRGLSGDITTGTPAITSVKAKIEDEKITILVDTHVDAEKGGILLKGLKVTSNTRGDVSTGDVTATITAVNASDEDVMDKVTEKVAVVSEYDVKLSVKDDKAVEFIAGGAMKEVEITLAELAAGTLEDKDNVYFKVKGADVKKMGTTPVAGTGKTTIQVGPDNQKVNLTYDAKDKEFTLDLGTVDTINETVVSKYTIKLTLAAKPDATDEIVVTAESKAFDDKEVTVGTVKTDRTFEVSPAKVTIGTKGQKNGSVTLTEDKAKTFKKGQVMFIELEEDAVDDGVRIKDFKVVTDEESGLKAESVDAFYEEDSNGDHTVLTTTKTSTTKAAKNVIAVEITKESKEAGSLTIEEIKVDTTNATPDGTYKAKFSGALVSHPTIGGNMSKEFVIVGEGAADKQAKVVLTVGNATYTVDGEEKVAEVAPFIDPATDRTMAPVRAVAEAFGCELDFFFPADSDQLVIVLTKGGNRVQFQNGSNIMVVNGGQFIMSATAQIKDGYTFVPVAFLAQALNIDYTWLPDTQEIVFGNK